MGAKECSGELGDFCRKTGDFTNKIGYDIKEKLGNENENGETHHKADSFLKNQPGSEGDKKNKFLSKVGRFITRFGKSVNKRWNEAKSVPLREETTTTPNSVNDKMNN